MKLVKVISGGQIGADQAGLAAAYAMHLDTGGTAPQGFKTAAGPAPWLGGAGLVEHDTDNYRDRTFLNVKNADATLRIAFNLESPGEKCTLKAIKKYNKPYLDIHVQVQSPIKGDRRYAYALLPCQAAKVAQWLHEHEITTLNIAGNREPGNLSQGPFFNVVTIFLIEVFTILGNL